MDWLSPAQAATIAAPPPPQPLVERHGDRLLAPSTALAQRLGRPHDVVIARMARYGFCSDFVTRNFVSSVCGTVVFMTREAIEVLLGPVGLAFGWQGPGVECCALTTALNSTA